MPEPERSNWIPERAKCNTTRLLEALAEIVEQDVAQANETLKLQDNLITIEHERRGIRVIRPAHPRPVAVTLAEGVEQIRISGWHSPTMQAFDFAVVPEWNLETYSCQLRVDDQESTTHAPWQIVQQALGWLFFEDWPSVVPARTR